MKLQHIELSQLKLSPANVRKHGVKDDLGELIASIRGLGVIQPLLVRPNCDGFEVVAGQRRLLACQALAQESGKAEPVPCAVLDSGDDALAIEASLAENVARLPMDEIDQYEAFSALKAQGRGIADIAGQFGVTELLVKRRLAIADLITPILNAYRKGDIEPETIQQLTMATPAQQKAWFKLFRDPNEHAPTGRRLKAWLFGAEIPVSSALFPVEQYGGGIIADLFGEQRYFDDAEKFWKLQMQAVAARQAEYLAAGWSDVVVMEIGKGFFQYDKAKRGRKDGGKVYVSCAANGEIGFHEGWLDQKEADRRDKAKAKADAKAQGNTRGEEAKDQAPATPELTKPAIRYLDLHRQNAVRVELLKSPQIALRLIAASVIGYESLWDVRPESQSANGNGAIAGSIEGSKASAPFDAERKAVRELLGLPAKDGSLLWGGFGEGDACALFTRLLAMTDKEVLRVLALLMAESLPAGSAEVEALGHILKVDMDKWWTPDEAFFDLLRDKPAITAMVEEVAGKRTALEYRTATAKVQKDVIRSCLAGANGRKKVEGWQPRYMRFPMQGYTRRRGLPAVAHWNAIRKHFDKKA
jgi:ParB family chromosome partitioning protein